ncbi:terpene synthase family protein [Nocardia rhamnosiphila]
MQQSNRAPIDVIGPDFPGFYCPFETKRHPAAEEVQLDTIAWARRVELGGGNPQHSDAYASVGSLGACLWYPDAPRNRVQSGAQISAWTIMMDDLTDSPTPTGRIERSPAEMFARLVRISEVPSCALLPGDNVADALVDIVHQLQTWADPTQMRWFSQAVRQWLLGELWEQDVRRIGLPLTLNDYLIPRNWSMNTMFAATVGAMSVGLSSRELPDHVLDSPVVRAATEAAMTLVVIDNERYSYAKTVIQGDSHIDLFRLVRQERKDMSFTDAVVEVIAIRDRIMQLYIRLREQMWPSAGNGLRQYLKNLEYLVSGNIEFGREAARFRTAGTTTAPRITTTPSDNRPDPLPLPSVRWWWDQLSADPT